MDTSPTALFDSYEQDFKQFIETIHEKLEDNGGSDKEQRKATLRRVEMELDEADEMLVKHKKLLADSRAQVARSDLLSSSNNAGAYPSSDEPYGPSSDRTRLLAGTSLLEDGSKRLQQSHQIALETENQGADILLNLRTQREQIENSRNTLQTADLAIDRASGTLKKMVRRMYQQRAVTFSIVGVLILLIIVIVWEKLSR
ncbi:vesicle transport v-snare protein vti1 [Flammula alnicola]|nr:vesicle transport v-snare protein vti1 [Flammula alnicola]